jgi:hypothetical protein
MSTEALPGGGPWPHRLCLLRWMQPQTSICEIKAQDTGLPGRLCGYAQIRSACLGASPHAIQALLSVARGSDWSMCWIHTFVTLHVHLPHCP